MYYFGTTSFLKKIASIFSIAESIRLKSVHLVLVGCFYLIRMSVKDTRVVDNIINRDKTEYSSHKLTGVVDGKQNNDWILIMISMTGK